MEWTRVSTGYASAECSDGVAVARCEEGIPSRRRGEGAITRVAVFRDSDGDGSKPHPGYSQTDVFCRERGFKSYLSLVFKYVVQFLCPA